MPTFVGMTDWACLVRRLPPQLLRVAKAEKRGQPSPEPLRSFERQHPDRSFDHQSPDRHFAAEPPCDRPNAGAYSFSV
jgi:hypothetical protein